MISEITMEAANKSSERVQQALDSAGMDCKVIKFGQSTKTAQDAADAVGCRLEQIVKSLVFRGKKSGEAVFIAAGGASRVNEKRFREYLGEAIEKATPEFVREHTGFAIGGVAPVAHIKPMKYFIDQELMKLDTIWAAAGTPDTVFRLTPAELQILSKGTVVDIS